MLQLEATCKAEAEHLDAKYKEDQLVNIVKIYENNQPIMNSINRTAEKVAEELNQSTEKSDTKEEGIQHTKARLVGSFK